MFVCLSWSELYAVVGGQWQRIREVCD